MARKTVDENISENLAEFAEEPDDRQYGVCLRCEVRIYHHADGGWRGLITDSPVCMRNPAQDGHEPRPTP